MYILQMNGDENEFDFLLDDLDTINELTKFDELNRGHRPETVERCDTKANWDNNTQVHFNKFEGRKQDFVPEPVHLATVFRETLFGQGSGPQGVAPLDRANSSKPVSSGRGQRHLKIKEQRMANKRALLNPPPSSLSMIQKDIAQSNVLPGSRQPNDQSVNWSAVVKKGQSEDLVKLVDATRQQEDHSSSESANSELSNWKNGQVAFKQEPSKAFGLQSIGDSLLTPRDGT